MLSVQLQGGVLASGGQDRTIKLWSLPMVEEADGAGSVLTLTHGGSVRGLAVSREGFIASAGGTDVNKVIVWQPA